MKNLTMDQNLLRWSNSFLVKVLQHNMGVSQANPLSPVLLIIYVSDILKPENGSLGLWKNLYCFPTRNTKTRR